MLKLSLVFWPSPLFSARKRNVCFPFCPSGEITNIECTHNRREEMRSQTACNARDAALGLPSLAHWTGLLEAQEGEVIHTAKTHTTSKFMVLNLVGEKRGQRAWPSFSNFSTPEFPPTAHFRRFHRTGWPEGRKDSLLLPYLPSLYTLSLFSADDSTGSCIHTINECLREGASSQSQSRGRVETSVFWRQYVVGAAQLVKWLQPTTQSHASWMGTSHRQKRAICKNWGQRKLYTYL